MSAAAGTILLTALCAVINACMITVLKPVGLSLSGLFIYSSIAVDYRRSAASDIYSDSY